jgi:predicted AlkP superfamily phosphohydrolase/phosphomutase
MAPTIALWAMVRDEALRLAPWIRYHRALGVGPIILYADRCTDDTAEVAEAFDDVWVTEVDRPADEAVSVAQNRYGTLALDRARELGCDWLLGVDVDEFAWGGSVADLRQLSAHDVLDLGSLQRLVESTDASVGQIRLQTLETVPLRLPIGRHSHSTTWVQHGSPHVRSLTDPSTGAPRLMEKFIGHQLGKTLVRVHADLLPNGPHGWLRSDGSEPSTSDAGLHLHYFVSDYESWVAKCRGWVDLGDTWDGVIPRPFPRNEWRDFVAGAGENELRAHFATAIAVDERVLEPFESEHLFPTDVVPIVLDAAKPNAGRKFAFIGLDCFDLELFERWASKGLLPTLAGVANRSARLDTLGPPGTYVSSIWPDLYSGVGAGKHGVQCWKQLTRGTYDFEWHRIRTNQTRRVLWDSLESAGYRSAIVDAPLTPGWAANGLQVFEWGNHDPEIGFAVHPAGLDQDVRDLVGHHGVEKACNQFDRTPGEIADFRDRLVEGARKRSTLLIDMLGRDDWDLFLGVYSESHCVGHQTWHYHDDTSPKWSAEDASTVGDPVEAVYRSVDAGLGEVLAEIDDETTVAVWLSHGMGNHTYPTYLNDGILYALDMQRHERERRRSEGVEQLSGETHASREAPTKDYRASRLFFDHMNNDPESGVRLNVVGREPRGLVQPGREYDNMCDWLAEQYYSLTDAATGAPLVDEVLFMTEHYDGPYVVDLPDLFIRWRRAPSVVRSATVGETVVTGHPTSCRTGDHHPRGRLYVYGPGIAPGLVQQDEPLLSRDITALLAGFFEVDMDTDGVVSPELLRRVFGEHPTPNRDSRMVSTRPTTRHPSRGVD